MDILTRITVPKYIYQFYADASQCVCGHTAEDLMADALTAYAAMLSDEMMKHWQDHSAAEESI